VHAEIVVETVAAPDAQSVLARWGERLSCLGRERLHGDTP